VENSTVRMLAKVLYVIRCRREVNMISNPK